MKAVADAKASTPQARDAIYVRARAAMLGRLRSMKPALRDHEVERETAAFGEAVRRLEKEAAAARKPPPRPAAPPGAGRPPPEAGKPPPEAGKAPPETARVPQAPPRSDPPAIATPRFPARQPLPPRDPERDSRPPRAGPPRAAASSAVQPHAKPRSEASVPRSDFVLIGAGIVAAVVSGSFGIYMAVAQKGDIRPSGAQVAALQPEAAVDRDNSAERDARSTAPDRSDIARIDPVATGSIPADASPDAAPRRVDPTPSPKAAGAKADLKRFHLRGVFDGMALIESPYGLTLVHPDAVLLGAGRVISIEQQGGKWIVATQGGDISDAGE